MSHEKKSESRLVYSTKLGRIEEDVDKESDVVTGNGRVRVYAERSGRRGKIVTVITELPLEQKELKVMAKKLKQSCGVGGTVSDGCIELQGEHVIIVVEELKRLGFNVKRSGK